MAECAAIEDRQNLIRNLRAANDPMRWSDKYLEGIEGTEEELMRAWNILQGVVNEYKDGGDQMVENCTCGKHIFSADHQRVGDLVVDIKDDDPITGSRWSDVPSIAIYLSTDELTTRIAHLTWSEVRALEDALMEVRSVAARG